MKVATPETANALMVPVSVPAAGLTPSEIVTIPEYAVAGFPSWSSAVTTTAGAIPVPAWTSEGCAVNARRVNWLT